jgi:hypothetical protein
MNIKDLFDSKGNFLIKGFDPCRKPDGDVEYNDYWNKLFCDEDDKWGEYGSVKMDVDVNLMKIIKEENWSPFCDAVKLMYAQEHGIGTKGSYPAIYMWR